MWPEFQDCLDKGKHTVKVSGPALEKRLEESGSLTPEDLNPLGANVTSLELSKCSLLTSLPDTVADLTALLDLLLPDNHLTSLPDTLGQLKVLRTIIAEGNQLEQLPHSLCKLPRLHTLNIARNRLIQLPANLGALVDSLVYINVSNNSLSALPGSITQLTKLSTLICSHNQIVSLPGSISKLVQLSDLDASHNKLTEVPQELAAAPKLKSLQLSDNPFKDKKLIKVLKEGRLKNILGHISKHGAPPTKEDAAAAAAAALAAAKLSLPQYPFELLPSKGSPYSVYIHPSVKGVRPHFVAAVLLDVHFTPARFERFISLQTELHTGSCAKRSKAAIGTHDLSFLQLPLHFEALPPQDVRFVPLMRDVDTAAADGGGAAAAGSVEEGAGVEISAAELGKYFAGDATMLKYLSYIEGVPSRAQPLYAILQDDKKTVLSVSPVINSQPTRVTLETQNVLVEVSSPESMELAQEVALEFLSKFAEAWSEGAVEGGKAEKLQVAPVRLLTPGTDHVRLVFPKG